MAVRIFLIFILNHIATVAAGQQISCDEAAFRSVVTSAGASLSKLHDENNQVFQEKLQKLRILYKWSDSEFLGKATPFVKDETTASLDASNQALLAKVQALEPVNAGTEPGRCAMLAELKGAMDKVVANTAMKWQHMLAKVSEAGTAPLQAGVAQ